MKKIVALFAIVGTTMLASCGNGASTEVKSDSTVVSVDSLAVDTTAAPVDSVKVDVEKLEEVK